MSITNEDRYHLQAKANAVLGEKEGATLMELLPTAGWAEVATKSDLNAQTTLLDAKLVALRSDLTAKVTEQVAELRAETAGQFTKIRTETTGQFTKIRTETAGQFASVRSDIQKKHDALLRTMFSLAAAMTAILTVVITLAT